MPTHSHKAGSLPIKWWGQRLQLMPSHCIFWEEAQALILADVHFGKAGHFRRAGIPISAQVHQHDLATIGKAVEHTQAKQVIFLGDLFHSEHNAEWETLEQWLTAFPHTRFRLVEGNHDRHSRTKLPKGIEACGTSLAIPPFRFTHEPAPLSEGETDLYHFCGHVHPAVSLQGKGRQRMRLPCFFFGRKTGILPAFGKFTGLYNLTPTEQDHIFVVAGSRVIAFSA